LLLEEYVVSFEYLPGRKNVVADALSCLDIDDLKIQGEEFLTFLSESEQSNIKFPMHIALIFKEQTRVNGLREKELSQPYYSMQFMIHVLNNLSLEYELQLALMEKRFGNKEMPFNG
jgi:hypothetical protein